ncbi:MAG: DUF4402 domain-containing protein [Pseudomonadota bacterium]
MAARNISTSANMAFGRFAAGSGGAVTLAVNGARSRSGGVILFSSAASAAAFSFSGNDNRITILTLPANGAVSLVSGANQMPLTAFTSSLPAGGLLASGVKAATVGATLQVAPSQAPGNYTGAFQAILEFQ